MNVYIRFLLCFLVLWSCQSPSEQSKSRPAEKPALQLPTLEKLAAVDSTFFTTQQKPIWPEYIELYSKLRNLEQLRPEGLDVFLIDLEKQSLQIIKKPFPLSYEQAPIRGRIKVMHTMIMQARYAAFKNDSTLLHSSLQKLYTAVQALHNRLESIDTASSTLDLNPNEIGQ